MNILFIALNMHRFIAGFILSTITIFAHAQQLVINEIQSSNIDQIVDPSFNYGGWIEVYNPASSAQTITNWWLSDDPENLQMAKIHHSVTVPAKGYATLYFDHYSWAYAKTMIDMKLDCDGGNIYLSNASGVLQASAEYPAAIARSSWCRTTDGGDTWGWTASPTPASTNNNSTYCETRLEEIVVDTPSKMFDNSLTFRVEIPEGCTLKYTTNGSTPSLTNGSTTTTKSFTTSVTRTYRFCLIRNGYLTSKVTTRTFVKKDRNYTLPVFAINSANDNFYGNTLGIFVKGTNGRPGNGQYDKCNWNMDWERPASFEYYTPNGECVVNQETGIERCGGWSRAWNPCSFKIKANKVYEGASFLPYQFFDSKPYLKHKTLQVRNGGNDNGCRIRDAALQEIVRRSGINIDCQAYQPAAHFVNGVYKGVINVREPNNKHFVYANYGIDDDELDQFEMSPDSGYIQKCGTKEAFTQWYNLSKSCSSASIYEQICELVDIEEFCNYMAIQFYLGNWDWPQNNLKAYHPTYEGGRFRFVLYDLDGAFSTDDPFNTFANKKTYTFDNLLGAVSGRYTKEIEIVTIFLNMLNNATFRKQFIDTYCLVAGSVFEPTRCTNIINELVDNVSTMMAYSNESPTNTANSVKNSLSTSRQTNLINKLKSYSKFQLTSTSPRNVRINTDCQYAKLMVNGLPVPTNTFNGKLFGTITVSCNVPSGYNFVGWKEANYVTTTLLAKESTWKYYDQGSLDGTGWKGASYNDNAWKSGKAPLGYYVGGSRAYNTTLSYGNDVNNKRPTYYFRTSINIDKELGGDEVFSLDYVADDGFVIYVNGREAGRYLMPSGTPSYSTYASTYANGNPDSGTLQLEASYFKKGTNVIAVELHNNSANSTDVYWDAALSMQKAEGTSIKCTTVEYTIPSTATNIIACFEKVSNDNTCPIVINEVSAGNDIHVNDYWKKEDWIELYNTTDEEIDLAGMYLSDKADNPYKWQISGEEGTNTKIAPHGYKMVWCDKKDSYIDLHAPFKLNNEDDKVVVLTAADGSWYDAFTYCAHDSKHTVGRYPDGSDNIYVLTRTTPSKTNVLTQLSLTYDQPNCNINDIHDIELDETYKIYDLRGIELGSGLGEIDFNGLPSGIYIVRRGQESIKVVR